MQFRLAEYNTLRASIAASLQEMRQLERYVLVACALVYAWLTANNVQTPAPWWIPTVLVLLGVLRTVGMRGLLNGVAAYLRDLEAYAFEKEPLGAPEGWERRLERLASGEPPHRRTGVHMTAFWSLLFVATIAAALVHGRIFPPKPASGVPALVPGATTLLCQVTATSAECRSMPAPAAPPVTTPDSLARPRAPARLPAGPPVSGRDAR